MTEPTLQQVFGINASQSANELSISKQDLAAVGLTPTEVNTPESLLAAILSLAQVRLTKLNFDTNLHQSIVISNGTEVLVNRHDKVYRQSSKIVEFYKIDNFNIFDPDNY